MRLAPLFGLTLLLLVPGAPLAQGPTRLPDGSPGPGYWQQKVNYQLEARLDPAQHRLTGQGWITYHNRSPHALSELHWHLYQNFFRPELRRSVVGGRRVPTTSGISVRRVEANGAPLVAEVQGTLMRTALPAPLAPGDSLRLRVEWELEVPRGAALRTGSSGSDFALAQWYPQVAVFDDVHGWNRTPYRGQGEFYTEYGDWDVRLDVPGNYVVAATGTLQNSQQVLNPYQRQRLRAAPADTVLSVIHLTETGPARDSLAALRRVWHFRAENVRDFAWAASPEFVWDVTRTAGGAAPGVLVHAFYRPGDGVEWMEQAARARHTMELFSTRFGPYAYPQVSVVSGPVTGMEYPMLVFASSRVEVDRVTAHELAHQWYPMMLGSHETRFPFLDEGLSTFLTSLALDDPARPGRDTARAAGAERRVGLELYHQLSVLTGDLALTSIHSDSVGPLRYLLGAYLKPAGVMFMLRDVLGSDTLDAALREYHRRWLFRHPYPDDFFRTVESVAGRDLGWFWEQWFRRADRLDLAVDDLRQGRGAWGWRAEVDLVSREAAVMPARVRLRLANGTTRDARVPVEAWAGGRLHTLRVDSLPSRVVSVEIDPERVLLDVAEANNRWPLPLQLIAEGFRIRREASSPLAREFRALSVAPELGENDVDGTELGFTATGRLGPSDARLQAGLRVGLASGRADTWLAYLAPVSAFGPTAAWGAQIQEVDGRFGADLELQVATRPRGLRADTTGVDRRWWLGLHMVELRDSSYLPEWNDWEPGWLRAASARLRQPRPGWWGEGQTIYAAELGLPGSDRLYAKASADLRTRFPLTGSTALRARGFAGVGLGDVPAQTEFYLAQVSPWERFSSYRHVRGAGDRARRWGGGAVVAAAPEYRSEQLLAANLALETHHGWFWWEGFADAGATGFDALAGAEPWFADAGVGLGVRVPVLGNLWLRFPLWVRDPYRPEQSGWGFRWRVMRGGR